MEKVWVIEKLTEYEGSMIQGLFSNKEKALEYINLKFPHAQKDKEGDWIITSGLYSSKEWLSLYEEIVN